MIEAFLACMVTMLAGFHVVRCACGTPLTNWARPRVGRWFDALLALGVMFVMVGWFVPPTVVGGTVWGASAVVGISWGSISEWVQRRAHQRTPGSE